MNNQGDDDIEAMLLAAGAKREEYAGTQVVFQGELRPNFKPGDAVQVRIEDGSWKDGLRAISGVEAGENEEEVVCVCLESEWQAAVSEERQPEGAPWPYKWVEFSK